MDPSAIPFLIAAAAAVGFAVLIYRQRELSIRGRWILSALRAAVLVVTLLLLWNPPIPGGLASPGETGQWVLVDGSMSMTAAGGDGPAWEEARERATALDMGGRLAVFGDDLVSVPRDSLRDFTPDGSSTRLAAALERAVESGARRVTVVSDMRVADPAAVEAVLDRTAAEIRFEPVLRQVRNAGVADVVAPRGVQPEEPVPLEVILSAEGTGTADSASVEVREEGQRVATRRVQMPAGGRRTRLALSLPPPAHEGNVRYTVSARLDGDAFVFDDQRVLRVMVGPEIRGVVLVSLRPDWEPRFLLPVLSQVTGLAARGYLALQGGQYLSMERGSPGTAVGEDEVRSASAGADILVVHGAGGGAPSWLRQRLGEAPRSVVFPVDPGGAALVEVRAARPLPGEWYAAAELPPSPLARELSEVETRGLPPLADVLPVVGQPQGAVPMELHRDGTGPGEAALVLLEQGRRRAVVVLASGFWRWAFRDGTPRTTYRRLWAAVGGWLLENQRLAGDGGVALERSVMSREEPLRWRAPGLEGTETVLRVTRGDTVVVDTLVRVPAGETFTSGPLPPGTYDYQVRGPGEESLGAGSFDVEPFTEELLLQPMDLPASERGRGAEGLGVAAPGRPLRTHPGPYLLLLVLLSAEWIGRRRKGLR